MKFLLIHTLDNHIDTEHKENVDENEESYNLDTSSELSMSKKAESEAESDLSGIDLKLGTFHCDLCTEMFSSDYISVLSVCRHHL